MTALAIFDTPGAYPDEYKACRGTRQHWMETIPVPAGTPRVNGSINIWWRCVRCATERHDQHNAFTLELESRSYQYPTGYNVPRDEMPDAATWKVTYLQLVGAVSGKVAGQVRRYHRELWEAEGH